MITLIGGNFQTPDNLPISFGSINFELNVDATIIANPFGIIPGNAGRPVNFQLDANGNILPNTGASAQIFSNEELQPQISPTLLGTWYHVSVYTQNGARISAPMSWQFTQTANSTVNLSTMTPISTGGNIMFYAAPALLTGNNIWTGTNTFNGPIVGNATGIISATSIPAGPATAGVIRLAAQDLIEWRNAANNGNVTLGNGGGPLGTIPADTLVYAGSGISATAFLTGNSSSVAGSGAFRLVAQGAVAWRNGANSTDLSLATDGFDRLAWAGVATFGTLIEATTHTPSSSGDVGVQGQFAWDSNFIYLAISPNTWKRVAISTW